MSIDFTVEKSKKFKFTAVCKDLEQVISRVNTAMGASSAQTKLYFIAAKGGKLCVIAYSQDTFCAVKIANAVSEGEGIFGFDPASLSGIIKGRSQMDFDFNGRELEFKLIKGKYNGTITLPSSLPEHLAHIRSSFAGGKKDTASELSRDLLSTLKEGMMLTSIKDVFATNAELASHIVIGQKLVTISAFDTHHFALYTKKVKSTGFDDLRVVLPVNHFNIIDKMVDNGDKSSKFVLRTESVRVEGSNFLLVLPAIQTNPQNFQIVQSFLKAQGDMPQRYSYKSEELGTLVNNLYTLHAVNANLEISSTDKGLAFSFNTQNGRIRDVLKSKTVSSAKKDAQVTIDPALIKDLINLSKGQEDTELSFNKKTFRIDCKAKSSATLTLTCALAQSSSKK